VYTNPLAGANVSSSMAQSNPYTTTATNPQVTKFAQQLLTQMEPIFPGITAQWNGKAMLSTPFTDPNFLCSYSYWKPGQYTGFSGYEKRRFLSHRWRIFHRPRCG
jgi:monoamine oxidase